MELATPIDGEKTIFVLFPSPGQLETEVHQLRGSLTDSICQHWTRMPHETEEAFKERASKEVKRSPYGVALLFKSEPTA